MTVNFTIFTTILISTNNKRNTDLLMVVFLHYIYLLQYYPIYFCNLWVKSLLFYRHPHDVDLWSGGVSERPLPGSMLGPTFACIIATQFSYSRRGDRFWFVLFYSIIISIIMQLSLLLS